LVYITVTSANNFSTDGTGLMLLNNKKFSGVINSSSGSYILYNNGILYNLINGNLSSYNDILFSFSIKISQSITSNWSYTNGILNNYSTLPLNNYGIFDSKNNLIYNTITTNTIFDPNIGIVLDNNSNPISTILQTCYLPNIYYLDGILYCNGSQYSTPINITNNYDFSIIQNYDFSIIGCNFYFKNGQLYYNSKSKTSSNNKLFNESSDCSNILNNKKIPYLYNRYVYN
jgi:hypothetical protein